MKWILLITLLICLAPAGNLQTGHSSFSCVGRFLGPPCEEFWLADIVFIGTATEVVTIPKKSADDYPYWQQYLKLTARITIDEAFRGDLNSEINYEVSNCYYPFKQGEKYLIYAHKTADGKLSLTMDSTRTRPLSEAQEDLEYIRSLPQRPDGGRIYGKVYDHIISTTLRGAVTSAPTTYGPNIPKIKIVAEKDGQRYETMTDETGSYEFLNLPEGIYKMRALVPSYFSGSENGARLANKGCSPVSFSLQATGTIADKVLDSNGQPVYNLTLSVFSKEGVTEELIEGLPPHYEQRSITDKQGQFKFHRLPSGQYFIAVNLVKYYEKSSSVKYPRSFYPGVANLSDAKIISLSDGEQKQNIELVLPIPQTIE